MIFSTPVVIKLFSAALTLGFAYAAWNVGILHGNVTIMAVGSYFTPVLSSALAAVLLSAPLSFSFWQGAVMVCVGSLLCWLADASRLKSVVGRIIFRVLWLPDSLPAVLISVK
ncbi:Aromatic amino acid exporter YddG [Citrobacter koseri]|uniref:Aromatic amino acid exporter YddG n=1 Tax=Citrobacter koseri TaxID=545 RepID=A0A447UF44_CITKO|nr:Aromatic amino acid exporter YddG [Citrobacter koseri]